MLWLGLWRLRLGLWLLVLVMVVGCWWRRLVRLLLRLLGMCLRCRTVLRRLLRVV